MMLIALEEHMLPPDLINEVWAIPMAPESFTEKLVDVGEQPVRAMDDADIAMPVAVEHAAELCRPINDRCAEDVAAQPVRFNALATLPTQDPEEAIVEANGAITKPWRRAPRTAGPRPRPYPATRPR